MNAQGQYFDGVPPSIEDVVAEIAMHIEAGVPCSRLSLIRWHDAIRYFLNMEAAALVPAETEEADAP